MNRRHQIKRNALFLIDIMAVRDSGPFLK